MGIFKQKKEPTPGRPPGTEGDTGLNFAGWYNIASSTLVHASRDDDPRCMSVLCLEARSAAELAELYAKNNRQETMAKQLLQSIADIELIAKTTPALGQPHRHDNACEIPDS